MEEPETPPRTPSPFDFECPTCGAPPGERCRTRYIEGGWLAPDDYSKVRITTTHSPRIDKAERGCFITTACVEHAGLPDDCRELTVLRSFRDSYITALPNGSEILAEYYRAAPLIVHSIQHSSHHELVLTSLFENISDIVRLIESGFYPEALFRYRHIFNDLKQRYQRA